ncbi:hypothetical protein [Undibacterium sp. KW1]|uniref:hypothetical protein n=1 Tax=Undibacterium sp. KW1 TaxID=2058624 RepID=UPI00138A6460|nr:hypothetical protein [Undibacterium sp. KW1]
MTVSLIRKISSLLLLLCFVLPLSKCESKMQPQKEAQSQTANDQAKQNEVGKEAVKVVAKDNLLYGYVLLIDGWEDVRKSKTLASSLTMLAVLAVFFCLVGCWFLRKKHKSSLPCWPVCLLAQPCSFGCWCGERRKPAVCWRLSAGSVYS